MAGVYVFTASLAPAAHQGYHQRPRLSLSHFANNLPAAVNLQKCVVTRVVLSV